MQLFVKGSFIFSYLKPSADLLGLDLVQVPEYDGLRHDSIIDFVNDHATEDCVGFLYFPDFLYQELYKRYKNIKVKKIFWNIEDPNHFNTLARQAATADFIFTTAAELARDYVSIFPTGKVVDVLTWACDPEIHFPRLDDMELKDREFDIVFVGNRYPDQWARMLAEKAVLLPALAWGRAHNKKMGVWGIGDGSRHSWRYVPAVWIDECGNAPYGPSDTDCRDRLKSYSGIYQEFTGASVAPEIYRRSRVVLAMNEQITSPTMTSMRTYEACACGNIVLSHASPATESIFGGLVYQSATPQETAECLEEIFSEDPVCSDSLIVAQKAAIEMIEHHTYAHRLRKIIETVTRS